MALSPIREVASGDVTSCIAGIAGLRAVNSTAAQGSRYPELVSVVSGLSRKCTRAVHVRTTFKSGNQFLSFRSIAAPFHTRSRYARPLSRQV